MNIVLIGAGNVATHLGIALKKNGHNILQVYSRTTSSANKLAKKLSADPRSDVRTIAPNADLYVVSLSDYAIQPFLKTFPLTDNVVAHTSGSVPMSVFGKRFKHCGVIYPVQTFSLTKDVDVAEIPFCIEWNDAEAKKKIEQAVKSLSVKVFHLDSAERKKVHIAAVFANNFSNHLFSISERILSGSKLPFDILRPLILETAMKVQKDSPSHMQTGPARRGDSKIIEEHLKMLSKDKELKKIYEMLTKSISEHHGIRL